MAISAGFQCCVLSFFTQRSKAQSSSALDLNSVPLSTLIVLGHSRSSAASSSAMSTHLPVRLKLAHSHDSSDRSP